MIRQRRKGKPATHILLMACWVIPVHWTVLIKNRKELKSVYKCEVLGIDDLSKIFHDVQYIMSRDFILPKPSAVVFFLLCV